MSHAEQGLPPAAVLVSHQVEDWDRWKKSFDDHEEFRRDAGWLGHDSNRAENDPYQLTVYAATADLDRARAFFASDELRAVMERAGVVGRPDVTRVTPKRENAVWERNLPAMW